MTFSTLSQSVSVRGYASEADCKFDGQLKVTFPVAWFIQSVINQAYHVNTVDQLMSSEDISFANLNIIHNHKKNRREYFSLSLS